MPSYRAKEVGFFDGSLYGPNHPRRQVVHTDMPLNPIPSWLEAVEEETQVQRKRRSMATKKAADKVESDRRDIESASFTEDLLKSSGVETL